MSDSTLKLRCLILEGKTAYHKAKAVRHAAESGRLKNNISEPEILFVSKGFLDDLHHVVVSLKNFIDQAPVDNPLMWMTNREIPVTDCLEYEMAADVLDELGALLEIN